MKIRFKSIRPFLAVYISLLFLLCPAYLQYDDLTEIDFLSSQPSFENFDLDNLIADKNTKTKVHVSISSLLISPLDFSSFGQSLHLSADVFSLVQPILVLRC
jgi:hypothetical protein